MIGKRRITAVLACALLTTGLVFAGVQSSQAGPSWSGDGSGGWSGTGATFLPGGTFIGDPNEAGSDCPGCRWEVKPVCELEGPNSCQISYGCPAGQPFALIQVYTPSLGMTATVGSQCIPPGEPVTVEELARVVRERIAQAAPAQQPGFQPAGEALTSLPTIFWSGQDRLLERTDVISGLSVNFAAQASWAWSWGDGSEPLVTSRSGGAWPNRSLTHTYRKAGISHVVLRTSWDASFWVAGIGPFAVSGDPVTQETSLRVPVRQARAVLVES